MDLQVQKPITLRHVQLRLSGSPSQLTAAPPTGTCLPASRLMRCLLGKYIICVCCLLRWRIQHVTACPYSHAVTHFTHLQSLLGSLSRSASHTATLHSHGSPMQTRSSFLFIGESIIKQQRIILYHGNSRHGASDQCARHPLSSLVYSLCFSCKASIFCLLSWMSFLMTAVEINIY